MPNASDRPNLSLAAYAVLCAPDKADSLRRAAEHIESASAMELGHSQPSQIKWAVNELRRIASELDGVSKWLREGFSGSAKRRITFDMTLWDDEETAEKLKLSSQLEVMLDHSKKLEGHHG